MCQTHPYRLTLAAFLLFVCFAGPLVSESFASSSVVISQVYGGGGHKKAAGFELTKDIHIESIFDT